MHRIVFTGAQGTGKTTVLKEFENKGELVIIVEGTEKKDEIKEINGTWDADEITYDAVYPADNSTPQITYGTEIIDFVSGTMTIKSSKTLASAFSITVFNAAVVADFVVSDNK